MKSSIGFIILFIIISTSCRKTSTEPQLPPITHIGANTFGCKINGHVWVPHVACGTPWMSCELTSSIFPQFYPNETLLPIYIQALQDFGNHSSFNFTPFSTGAVIHDTANRVVNGSNQIGVTYGDRDLYYKSNWDSLGNPILSHFDITYLDSVNQIIAGTFSFTLRTLDWKDSVVVTDGRFDFKLGQQCRCSQ